MQRTGLGTHAKARRYPAAATPTEVDAAHRLLHEMTAGFCKIEVPPLTGNAMSLSLPRSWVRIAATASLLLAVNAHAGSQDRPFTATLRIAETVNFTFSAPCFAVGMLSASGNATHLGRVSAGSQDCINPLGIFDPNGPSSFQFASRPGSTTLTGANGDSLTVVYSGTIVAKPGGPHRLSGHFVITGGSGRFEGASGGGTMEGYEDISRIVVGEGEIRFEGRIAY
jgi:hypothetical protein